MQSLIWHLIGIAAIFAGGFLVGRNNPNLKAVNKLIDTGKAAVDTAGKIIKKI